MRKYYYSLGYIIVFLLSQALCSIPLILHKEQSALGEKDMGTTLLAAALIGSSILTILLLAALRAYHLGEAFNPRATNWRMAPMCIIAALLGLTATTIANDFLQLPDNLEDQFLALSQSSIGIVAIGFFGPLVEELLFREGITGRLIRQGSNTWIAILYSSLLFGIVHGNPAQVPFAIIGGIILGTIYVLTGSVLLTAGIHILNNLISVGFYMAFGSKVNEVSLIDIVGGRINALVCILLFGTACFLILRRLYKENHLSPSLHHRPITQ